MLSAKIAYVPVKWDKTKKKERDQIIQNAINTRKQIKKNLQKWFTKSVQKFFGFRKSLLNLNIP
jgi:hypothetical protein